MAGIKAFKVYQRDLLESWCQIKWLGDRRINKFALIAILKSFLIDYFCNKHNKNNVKNKVIGVWIKPYYNPASDRIVNLPSASVISLYIFKFQKIELVETKGF